MEELMEKVYEPNTHFFDLSEIEIEEAIYMVNALNIADKIYGGTNENNKKG